MNQSLVCLTNPRSLICILSWRASGPASAGEKVGRPQLERVWACLSWGASRPASAGEQVTNLSCARLVFASSAHVSDARITPDGGMWGVPSRDDAGMRRWSIGCNSLRQGTFSIADGTAVPYAGAGLGLCLAYQRAHLGRHQAHRWQHGAAAGQGLVRTPVVRCASGAMRLAATPALAACPMAIVKTSPVH
eukprot:363006-Chlamydomonas_euryale.AAC.1